MRESSLVPTNLLNWPRAAVLLPEQKLILIALWASPYINCAGGGIVPPRPLSATLGLSPEATLTGLKNLRDAGLIMLCEDTAEVFIIDWYRFHKFDAPIQKRNLISELQKISKNFTNSAIKNTILEKSATYISTATATATATESIKPLAKISGEIVCKPGLPVTNSNSKPGEVAMDGERNPVFPTSPENPQDFSGKVFNGNLKKIEGDEAEGSAAHLPVKAPSAPAWEAYSTAFQLRYGVAPLRNAVANKAVKMAVDTLGVDVALKVLVHYLKSNDQFVLKNGHSLGIFMQSMNRFYVEWCRAEKGLSPISGPVTREMIREMQAGMHHNISSKDFRAGVDARSGQLID